MRCQHVDDDIQCRLDATRRVFVGCGDPPDPDQSGFAGDDLGLALLLLQRLVHGRPSKEERN